MKLKIFIILFVICIIIICLCFGTQIKDNSSNDEHYTNYINFNYGPLKGILKNKYSKKNDYKRVHFNV